MAQLTLATSLAAIQKELQEENYPGVFALDAIRVLNTKFPDQGLLKTLEESLAAQGVSDITMASDTDLRSVALRVLKQRLRPDVDVEDDARGELSTVLQNTPDAHALQEFRNTASKIEAKHTERKISTDREFTDSLAKNFMEASLKQARLTPEQTKRLSDTAKNNLSSLSNLNDTKAVASALNSAGESLGLSGSVTTSASRSATRETDALQALRERYRQIQTERAQFEEAKKTLSRQILTAPNAQDFSKSLEIADSLTASGQTDVAETSLKMARVSSAVAASSKETKSVGNTFFRSIARSPIQKALAPIADAATTVLGPTATARIAEGMIARSWEKLADPAKIGELFGEGAANFVRSNNAAAVNASGGSTKVTSRFQNIVDDVVGTVFGSPTEPMHEMLRAESAARATGSSPPVGNLGSDAIHKLYVALLYSHEPAYYTYILSGGLPSLSPIAEGTNQAISSAQQSAGILARAGLSLGKLLAGRGAGMTIGTLLGSAAGGPIGLVLGAGLSMGANALKGLYRFMVYGETPRVLSTFVILPALLLLLVLAFVAPLFTNMDMSHTSTRDSALVTAYGTGGGPGGTIAGPGSGRPLFAWNGTAPPPSDIRLCPVDHGQITQCPFTGAGMSHRGVDAYDIGANAGTPVKATHDGYIVSCVGSYSQGQASQTLDYGNVVVMIGASQDGATYNTVYSHLLEVVMTGVCENQGSPILVTAGTVIGYVDDTGYSDGNHLHYEYRGSGNLILPRGCAGYSESSCPNR